MNHHVFDGSSYLWEGLGEGGLYDGLAVALLQATAHFKGPKMTRANNASRGSMGALVVLAHTDALTPSDLADNLGLTKARVTNILNSLESRGLVERSHSSVDRRRVEVKITQAGREYMFQNAREIVHATSSVLERLGEQDSRELLRLIGRINEVIGEFEPTDPCSSEEVAHEVN